MQPHFVIHSEAEQGSEQWKADRKLGIASTDAAAALGISKWKTPLDLYREKIGEADGNIDPWIADRGHAMEPAIRQFYADEKGTPVIQVPGTLKHPIHDFVLASLDGYTQDGVLTEFKTYSAKNGWGDPGTDEVPQDYLVQVQQALMVTGLEQADIAVSFFGNKPEIYTVKADVDLQSAILDGIAHFWDKVVKRIEPEPHNIEEMRKKYRIDDTISAVASEEVMIAYQHLVSVRELVKQNQEQESELKEVIQRFLLQKGAAMLTDLDGTPLITWKEAKGASRLDTTALKKAHPGIVEEFTKVGAPSRRFLVK